MKLSFWLAILFLCTLSLRGADDQDSSSPLPPLPSGPLLDMAPASSQWLISTTTLPVDVSKNVKPKKFESRTLVRKTGAVRNEIIVTADGRSEAWFEYGWEAKRAVGSTQPQVCMPNGGGMANEFEDYSRTDFNGLEWISKNNYSGIQKAMGVDCIVFHTGPTGGPDSSATNSQTSDAPPANEGNTAYISLKTRLPVVLQQGNVTTFFEFQAPPSSVLTVPSNFEAAFANMQAILQRAAIHPGAPTSSPPPPLAPGPLLNKAPNFSQWLISTTSDPVDLSKNVRPQKYDSRTLVRKTGSIRNQTTLTPDGKSEQWFEYGMEAELPLGGKRPQVYLANGGTLFNNFVDYSQSDFQGFGWISKDNYVGALDVMGVNCIIFHAGPPTDIVAPGAAGSRANTASPNQGNTAYVTADTHLPVVLQIGKTTVFYEFQQPPTAMLVVPPNFEHALKNMQAVMQRASIRPAAP